jgi:hypothetical protein
MLDVVSDGLEDLAMPHLYSLQMHLPLEGT